jgi:hypothetical protein
MQTHDHEHGPDCDHDHGHEGDAAATALIAAVDTAVPGPPVPLAEVVEAVTAQGLVPAGVEPEGVVMSAVAFTDDLSLAAGEAFVYRRAYVLDGAVLTHRLTAEELAEGWLAHLPDLVHLADRLDFDESAPLAGGAGSLEIVLDPDGELIHLDGPDGWLDAFAAGDVVSLRWFARNEIELSAAGALSDGAAEVAAIERSFAAMTERAATSVVSATALLHDVLAAEPSVFRSPAPPLGELLETAGLTFASGLVGRAGTDVVGLYQRETAAERVCELFQLRDCCAESFAVAQRALDAAEPAAGDSLRALGEEVAHSDVARALVQYASELGDDTAGRLVSLAAALHELDGTARAAGAFVLALVSERAGHPAAAHRLVEEAIEADPGFLAATEQYARDRSMVGDIDAAIRVRQRLALPDDHELTFLRDLRPAKRSSVGRNDPCPCGSGKKFKACCIDKPGELDPVTHAVWLQHKLALYTYRPEHEELLDDLAEEALYEVDEDAVDRAETTLVESGLLGHWLAYEGGLAGDFLETFGPVLPAIERELLTDWVARRTSLYEVTGSRRSGAVALRDVRTGSLHTVEDPELAEAVTTGALLLARIGQVRDVELVVGVPLEIDREAAPGLLEVLDDAPGAVDFAAWWSEAVGAALAEA